MLLKGIELILLKKIKLTAHINLKPNVEKFN